MRAIGLDQRLEKAEAGVDLRVGADGDTQTVDSGDYIVDIVSSPARITPAHNVTWPSTRAQVNAVTVRFIAGVDDPANVDPRAKMLVKYLSANWYETRLPVGESVGQLSLLPLTVQSLVNNLKRVEFV